MPLFAKIRLIAAMRGLGVCSFQSRLIVRMYKFSIPTRRASPDRSEMLFRL